MMVTGALQGFYPFFLFLPFIRFNNIHGIYLPSAHTHCPQAPLPGVFYREDSGVQCFAQGHTENEVCNPTDTLKESACKCLVFAFLGAAAQGARHQWDLDFPDEANAPKQPGRLSAGLGFSSALRPLAPCWAHEMPEPRVGAHLSSMAAWLQEGSGVRYLQVSHLHNELSSSPPPIFNRLAFKALKIPHKIY